MKGPNVKLPVVRGRRAARLGRMFALLVIVAIGGPVVYLVISRVPEEQPAAVEGFLHRTEVRLREYHERIERDDARRSRHAELKSAYERSIRELLEARLDSFPARFRELSFRSERDLRYHLHRWAYRFDFHERTLADLNDKLPRARASYEQAMEKLQDFRHRYRVWTERYRNAESDHEIEELRRELGLLTAMAIGGHFDSAEFKLEPVRKAAVDLDRIATSVREIDSNLPTREDRLTEDLLKGLTPGYAEEILAKFRDDIQSKASS